MTATTNTSPVNQLLAELEAQAKTITLQTYGDFLHDVALWAADGTLDGIQQNAIVAALVANGNELGGKRIISTALNGAIKQIKRDMSAPSADMVIGGHGAYKPRDGWLCRLTNDGEYIKVSTAIEVLGRTRNPEQHGWGKLLQWQDGDGITHKWAMPMELVSGEGTEAVKMLQSRGLTVAGGGDKYLNDYLRMCDTDQRLTCVDKTGWFQRKIFVTAKGNHGDADGEYVYQGATISGASSEKGTLEGWKTQTASMAEGNSRLTFAISSAFAPALLDLAPSVGSGGIQFTGNSKDGKTLVLRVAASVWGHHERIKRSWWGTVNGIETLAAQHNDGWMFIDEQKRATAKEVDRIIYMLSDGSGKAKQQKDGGLRSVQTWKLLWMSSGELSAPEFIQQTGGTPPAGIEIRQADIPADAGKGFKIHDTIQDYEDLTAFNNGLGAAIESNYGVVGSAWLDLLTANREALDTRVPEMLNVAVEEIGGKTFGSQARDVLYRMALVAVGGELATEYGLTGWEQGDATKAAKRIYTDWLKAFGGDDGNREQRQIVQAVKSFLNANMSRFQNMAFEAPKEELQRVHNCVGGVIPAYDGNSQAVYLVFNSQIGELAKGYSKKQIRDAMEQAGMIQPSSSDGREYIPAHGRQRVTRIISTDDPEE